AAGPEHVPLADELLQRPRPHPRGQGRLLVAEPVGPLREQVHGPAIVAARPPGPGAGCARARPADAVPGGPLRQRSTGAVTGRRLHLLSKEQVGSAPAVSGTRSRSRVPSPTGVRSPTSKCWRKRKAGHQHRRALPSPPLNTTPPPPPTPRRPGGRPRAWGLGGGGGGGGRTSGSWGGGTGVGAPVRGSAPDWV